MFHRIPISVKTDVRIYGEIHTDGYVCELISSS